MKKYNDKRIIGAGLIFLMVAGFGLVQWFAVRPLSMDLPGEFYFNGAAIALAWTDDNSGENLIIQSDKKQYEGFSSAEVYFSVTNISRKTQEMDMVFWLEDGERVVERVELLDVNSQTSLDVNKAPLMLPELGSVIASEAKQSRDGDWIAASRTPRNDKKRKSINGFTDGYAATDTIQSGETRYYKALLKYPARANGEFFIEAFGNNGGYGHLDPWYSSSYQYKRAITLNASQIATTTDAFPVLATTTLADLKTVTNGGKVGNDNG
ncbi:MAG: hypothetical protein L6275_00365, partial [Candidatus Portnoybacteria bacterium]|nr:hypothetical protein [Candidatus Portnoybacteria bacterium]